jgi:hypothetical protein
LFPATFYSIKLVLLGIGLGLAVGIGVYTFWYGKRYSYMSNDTSSRDGAVPAGHHRHDRATSRRITSRLFTTTPAATHRYLSTRS